MREGRTGSRSRARLRGTLAALCLAVTAALAFAVVSSATGQKSGAEKSEWLANKLLAESDSPSGLKNNLAEGALAARDRASKEWTAAVARYKEAVAKANKESGADRTRLLNAAQKLAPSPLAKPEYVLVWSSHANASDENTAQVRTDSGDIQSNPTQYTGSLKDRFIPGADGFQVLDARRINLDGSPNPTYGHVVNFAQLPLPWGWETEAHHMQYQWNDGDPIVAGGLYNDTTFVVGLKDAPNLALLNTITPPETLGGSVPDAYDGAGKGTFIGTYMGGPNSNYAGSPGEAVALKPDPEKGLVVASEVPGGVVGARETGNPGGIPEPCAQDEAAPLDTCSNPHGVQIRPDLNRMVTADYGEPKFVVMDPFKPDGGRFFRPTVRVWDTTDQNNPKLISVAHMPKGWRALNRTNVNTMHDNRGVMEDAKTWPKTEDFPGTLESKGMFSGSMCGGGIFFAPDITKLKGDSSREWKQVWDDGISLKAARNQSLDNFMENEGPCQGGAWHQVTRNNRWLFRAVTGAAPNIENLSTNGQPVKVVYNLNIEALVKSGQDGKIACDLVRGIDTDGDGHVDISSGDTVRRVADGEQVADCPRLISTVTVDDPTTGGPHWGAIDNQSLTQNGFPTRLVFSDYFVSRSGVDGDHKLYLVNVDPVSGNLTYDTGWRDEQTGKLGVNFNRQDWPGVKGAGFYKPHSMVWICPPGICPNDKPAVGVPPARLKSKPRGGCADKRKFRFRIHHAKGARAVRVDVYVNGKRKLVKKGKNIRRVVLKRFPKRKFTVRIQVFQSKGGSTISVRKYKNCIKGAPKTRRGPGLSGR
ncbi:MAG TPA: hypothetical protein VF545_07415 [Thermoleophilaceae bacterium]|jgi:hypothetical protein